MIACALLPLLFACSEPDDTASGGALVTEQGLYELDVVMDPDPPASGPSTLTVEIRAAATGEAELGAELTVSAWMPDHGHGLGEEPVVTEADGVYTVALSWSMPGHWELTFVVDGSQGTDEVMMDVEVQ